LTLRLTGKSDTTK